LAYKPPGPFQLSLVFPLEQMQQGIPTLLFALTPFGEAKGVSWQIPELLYKVDANE